jgi:hypothetical protein
LKPLWEDTDPDTEAELIRRLREAPPSSRFELADALSFTTIWLSRQALARLRPDASAVEILLEWVGLHYGRDLELELRDHFGRRSSV